ncbi:hypothetical protein [Pseudoalteromonas sp. Z9A5]|uniref:hypothetical protein n=1 Tax=Pseudoalteromonas sp. Z9A5 TaxID=2686355 RepID=UPI0014076A6C|nr:hypothetical protein [Pseudoalteromonas sp. Z9A5]
MSKVPNKQSLLGKTPTRKKTTQKSKRQPATAKPNQTISSSNSNNTKKINKPKKGLFITLSIVAVIILAFPKPTLLTYKKLGMVSESIYWSGVFGYGATIIDSNLHPQLDSKRKYLYLCSDLKNPQSCQRYQVIADKGLFSAIYKYF